MSPFLINLGNLFKTSAKTQGIPKNLDFSFLRLRGLSGLAENIEIDLQKKKAEDFYWLRNEKVRHSFPTGPTKWSNTMN